MCGTHAAELLLAVSGLSKVIPSKFFTVEIIVEEVDFSLVW